MMQIRIEAEDMALTTYGIESNSSASGGKLISLLNNASGSIGSASTVFAGEEGSYNIVVGYYDENDGISKFKASVGGVPVDMWNLNQNLGSGLASPENLVRSTFATEVSLKQGTPIEVQGKVNQEEWARIDYIEFIPVEEQSTINGTDTAKTLTGNALNNIINGSGGDDTLIGSIGNDILVGGTGNDILDGGVGSDTASYGQATSAIIANLTTGVETRVAKVMPLGDSITYGIVNENLKDFGGYRTELWNKFKANDLTVDFVGSQSTGPDSLGDRDHEGHGGKTIDWIDNNVDGWLNTYMPDIVTLMIGTNDAGRGDSISQMSSELSDLIDKINWQLPDAQVLVASIPPINPNGQPNSRVQKALDFNAVIPDIVDDKVAVGKEVKFVDMTSLTVNDISLPPDDNGLHPTLAGYSKIADLWYDKLLDIGVDQGTFSVDKDTLSNIESIFGTNFDDTLVGNEGVNGLEGNAGRDTLTGGLGDDLFFYRTPTQGDDTITDFSGNDMFYISASGFGGGLQVGVSLSLTASTTGAFVSDVNPLPTGTGANFLYNTGTGVLSFDDDGTGLNAAVKMATLSGVPSLNPAQFTIFA